MYPGRRFALPWAISFCPFGAAESMVDCCLPGPSTPAEGVPALRAFAPQDAIYRGLRPRQRVCQPFGPMGHKMLLTGAFDPGRGCASPSGLMQPQDATYRGGRGCAGPSGLCATRLLLTGAFDPGRGCASPSGLWATRCYLPGPSTPAKGVPALRAYELQDCYLPGPSTPAEGVPALRAFAPQDCYLPGPSTPAEGVPGPRAYDMWGEFGGRESDRHATLRITDFQNGSGTVGFANSSSSKRSSCLATRLNSMCLPRTSPSQAQPPEL